MALVLIAGMASPAFAQSSKGVPPTFEDTFTTNVAPDHTEVGDTGSLPATSQNPGGSGALNSIAGSLSSIDTEDMYEICITDHNAFTAQVAGSQFDTQLFLFDSIGLGVYSNDDDQVIFGPSFLPSGHPNSPSADGTYYLAISEFDNEPNNAGGLIFENVGFTAINAPDLAAGGGSAITGWNGATDFGDFGTYSIVLTGVSATGCEAVGGESLSIDSTALILAGAQSFSWMIPLMLSVLGIGLFVVSRKSKNSAFI